MARVTRRGLHRQVAKQVRAGTSGSTPASVVRERPHITVDRENDKNAVIALREIAAKTVTPGDVSEGLIHSMQYNAEVDEPESTVALTLPHEHRPVVVRDDRSTDTVIDALTGRRN